MNTTYDKYWYRFVKQTVRCWWVIGKCSASTPVTVTSPVTLKVVSSDNYLSSGWGMSLYDPVEQGSNREDGVLTDRNLVCWLEGRGGQDRAVCRMPRSPHSQGQAGPAAISAPDYALRLKVFPPHTLCHPVPALLKRFYETHCIPVVLFIPNTFQ